MNKKNLIILIVSVLVVVILVPQIALAVWWNPFTWNLNIFKWFSKPQTTIVQPEQNINQMQTTLDTSNWKTYKNDKYGFEFKYPESFSVKEYPNGKGVDINCNTISQCSNFSVRAVDLTIPFDQYIKGLFETNMGKLSPKQYTLNNMQGYLISDTHDTYYILKNYIMENGNNALDITYTYADFSKELSDPKLANQLQPDIKNRYIKAQEANSHAQILISTIKSTIANASNQSTVNPPIVASNLPNIQDIVSKKDSALCKNLVPQMVDSCYLAIATSTNNAKTCELIQDRTSQGTYNSCYFGIAKNLKDESFCVYIKNVDFADECYSTLAIYKNDALICKKMQHDTGKMICVEAIVRIKNDTSLCNILPDITPRQACKEDPTATACASFNNTDSIRKLCSSGTSPF